MTKTLRPAAVRRRVVALLCTMPARGRAADPFALQVGDHICIIGNTLAERMQYDGWLETLLHARFPKHDLVDPESRVQRRRDRDASAVEELRHAGRVAERQGRRSAATGKPLRGTNTKADVIFAFFGYNESYAGAGRARGVQAAARRLDQHTLAQKYNGKTAPRIVLFSPIAHEDLHDPDLPDGKREQRAARAVHAGDGRGRPGARASRSSTCSRRAGSSMPRRRRR